MDPQNSTPPTTPPTTPPVTPPVSPLSSPEPSPSPATPGYTDEATNVTAPVSTPAEMPQYNAAPTAHPTAGHEDPGKLLGILGIVLGILILAPLGIILGIMSKNQSKAAGFDGSLGKVSIIIGSVLTALGVLGLILFVVVIAMADPSSMNTSY